MTRRARGFGAPSRIGVALLLAALAFAAALMADGGGGINPVFAQTTVDYDDDNDGLIDVRSLAQLDAIRHDLDGNGAPTAGAGATAYGIAFPNRVTTSSGRMGCPSGTCSGYELRAHLDFDTDGDGSTYAGTGDSAASDSGDAYHNSGNGWAPIGSGTSRFSATFKGNGFIISNLFIKRASTNWVGLFAALAGSARVESAGVHDGFVHGQNFVGILAGENKGTVAASWTTGAARGAAFIGGLVGYNVNFAAGDAGAVIACYSHASAHSTASSGNANMGGLVGTTQGVTGRPASLVASYSTGAVTAGTTSNVAALTLAVSPATITNSYYDSTTSVSSAGAGAGHATSALQTPTGYTGIYANWNVDVDGTTGNDDPWDFGTASQYPVLKFGGMDPDLLRAAGDYDLDNDGLIEITTLAQLDAVRHDVDGNGDPTAGAGATAYNAAFPIRIKTAATRMGCPAGTCSGYELAAHLDFDTDGDGATYTGTGTSRDWRLRRRLRQRRRRLGADWHRHLPIQRDVQGQRIRHLQPVHQADGSDERRAVRSRLAHRPLRERGALQRLRLREWSRGRVGRAQRGFGRRVLLHRLGSRRTGRRHRRLGRMVGEHRRLGTRNGVVFHGGGLYPQHRIPRRLGRSNGGRHPRLRQLLHRNGNDPRAQQRRRLRGRRRLYRRQRRDNHRVLLGLDHERQSRRRRHQPARRRGDRRPASPNGLRRHIRRLERERGRRIGR